jgi:ribosomal protein S12 methylthiotransferase accessory factor
MEITVTPAGGKKLEVRLGTHTIRTDLPVAQGGEDSAPTSYHTFLMSIAACAGIYALNFCQERGLSTEGLAVTVHADHDDTGRSLRKVRTVVRLPRGFPEKYRSALVRAVELCKVKKVVTDPPAFETTVENGPGPES